MVMQIYFKQIVCEIHKLLPIISDTLNLCGSKQNFDIVSWLEWNHVNSLADSISAQKASSA